MEKRILRLRMMSKVVMFAFLFGFVGRMYAYDFSAVCETGQTLYYTIIDATNYCAELVAPNSSGNYYDGWNGYIKPSGNIILDSIVTFENVNYSVTSIGAGAFFSCSGLTGSLTIPNSVTLISDYAFDNCSDFTGSLTIGNSVTTIGDYAFYWCFGFTGNLIIGNSVTSIGDYAFYNCYGFTGSLTIGNSVTTIGDSAFEYCSGFRNDLTIGNSVITIGNSAFYNCSGFTGALTIGNSVTTIGNNAFRGCIYFTGNLVIPNSVTKIGAFAFYNCRGFSSSLSIPNSVIVIGESAFHGTAWYNNQPNGILYLSDCCLGYKGNKPTGLLNLQNNTRLISGGAFISCKGLTGNLVLPDSVISIGEMAFFNCDGLTALTIPNSVTMIGESAFVYCRGLNALYYNGDLYQWCNIQFDFYSNPLDCAHNMYIDNALVTDLVIPEVITEIKSFAFYGATCITSLTIPSSVTKIDNYTFGNCISIGSMTIFAEVPPTLEAEHDGIISVFLNVHKSIPVYVPYGTIAAYQAAPGWNEFTNYQEMPPMNTTQTVELSGGWNWFSPNVEITLEDLQDALVDALPNANSIMIKSKNGITTYNGDTWRGQLDSLDVTQMYRISVSTACEITLEGFPIIPAEHLVTIHNGVNWIGFPLSENMTLNDAFAGFVVAGDMVKSKNGVATYNGTDWRGSLDTLEPGQGYIYKSNVQEDRTFIFTVSTK